jgi:hypothetical protein
MMFATIALAGLIAQGPNPVAAINAAKDARAKTEAAQKKNAEALDPQTPVEKPAPAGTPAASGAPAASVAPGAPAAQGAPTAPGAGYTYDPAGRRDPLITHHGPGGETPAPGGARPQGLPGLLINEMTLKGVMRTPKGDFVALLQAPDSKSYIGHAGEKVLDGAIKTITAGEVVFTQDVNDPLSLVKQREVRKAIRPEAR